MSRRGVQIALVVVGAVLVVGHLVALTLLGMTLASWLSGTVLGLLLAVVGGAHLLLGRRSEGGSRRQVVYGVVALVVGIVTGLLGVRLVDLGWWLIVAWAVAALGIGMLLEGPPPEKAGRLAAFGFSSVLIVVTGTQELDGAAALATCLGWSLLGAIAAVGVGALAHQVVSRAHAVDA